MQPDLPTPSEQQVSSPSPLVTPPVDPTPPTPLGMQPNPLPKTGGKKKLVIFLVIAAVIILLFGGSAAAYFGVVVPNKPENVLKQAFANSIGKEQVKSGQFDGEVSLSGQDIPKELHAITFNGGISQDENVALNINVHYEGGESGAEIRTFKGQDSYIKLTGLENLVAVLTAKSIKEGGASLQEVSQTLTLIKKFNNQWITIPQQFTKETGPSGNLITGSQLSDEDAQKLATAYKTYPFVTVTKNYPAESVNNVSSYHYQIGVDKVNLKSFLREVKNSNIKDLTITERDIDDIDKLDLSNTTIELWVAKPTKTFNKIKVSTKDKEGKNSATFVLTLKDINKPYTVEKPTGSVPLEQILNSLYAPTEGLTPLSGILRQ